jgi:hypothetical protein
VDRELGDCAGHTEIRARLARFLPHGLAGDDADRVGLLGDPLGNPEHEPPDDRHPAGRCRRDDCLDALAAGRDAHLQPFGCVRIEGRDRALGPEPVVDATKLPEVDIQRDDRTATLHRQPRRHRRVDAAAHERHDRLLCAHGQSTWSLALLDEDEGPLLPALDEECQVRLLQVDHWLDTLRLCGPPDCLAAGLLDVGTRKRVCIGLSCAARAHGEGPAVVVGLGDARKCLTDCVEGRCGRDRGTGRDDAEHVCYGICDRLDGGCRFDGQAGVPGLDGRVEVPGVEGRTDVVGEQSLHA